MLYIQEIYIYIYILMHPWCLELGPDYFCILILVSFSSLNRRHLSHFKLPMLESTTPITVSSSIWPPNLTPVLSGHL